MPMLWKKILVVEDDVSLRNKFHEIFFNKGQEVHCVPTAKEAFATLTEKRFDLILLDYSLPDEKAENTIKKIRDFDSEVKIILLYEDQIQEDQISSLKDFNIAEIIKKDFSNNLMMRKILEYVRADNEQGLPKSSPKFTKASILVVDDNDEIRGVLVSFLSKRGYKVRDAVSGDDAIAKIKQEKPEIVFLDFRMPGMDGVMTLNQIKRIDENINVVMLTSVQDEYIVQEVKREGACDYLVKPCDLTKLDKLITRIILNN